MPPFYVMEEVLRHGMSMNNLEDVNLLFICNLNEEIQRRLLERRGKEQISLKNNCGRFEIQMKLGKGFET